MDHALALKPRLRGIDRSQLLIAGIAALSALAILGLLAMVLWMSLRTGIPGHPSSYTFANYTSLLSDPYSYRVMVATLIFSAVTIAVSVPLGFMFAWLIERTDLPCKALAMSLLSIGILFPTFLKAMG
jgi:iron(III) transport system permease protein